MLTRKQMRYRCDYHQLWKINTIMRFNGHNLHYTIPSDIDVKKSFVSYAPNYSQIALPPIIDTKAEIYLRYPILKWEERKICKGESYMNQTGEKDVREFAWNTSKILPYEDAISSMPASYIVPIFNISQTIIKENAISKMYINEIMVRYQDVDLDFIEEEGWKQMEANYGNMNENPNDKSNTGEFKTTEGEQSKSLLGIPMVDPAEEVIEALAM